MMLMRAGNESTEPKLVFELEDEENTREDVGFFWDLLTPQERWMRLKIAYDSLVNANPPIMSAKKAIRQRIEIMSIYEAMQESQKVVTETTAIQNLARSRNALIFGRYASVLDNGIKMGIPRSIDILDPPSIKGLPTDGMYVISGDVPIVVEDVMISDYLADVIPTYTPSRYDLDVRNLVEESLDIPIPIEVEPVSASMSLDISRRYFESVIMERKIEEESVPMRKVKMREPLANMQRAKITSTFSFNRGVTRFAARSHINNSKYAAIIAQQPHSEKDALLQHARFVELLPAHIRNAMRARNPVKKLLKTSGVLGPDRKDHQYYAIAKDPSDGKPHKVHLFCRHEVLMMNGETPGETLAYYFDKDTAAKRGLIYCRFCGKFMNQFTMRVQADNRIADYMPMLDGVDDAIYRQVSLFFAKYFRFASSSVRFDVLNIYNVIGDTARSVAYAQGKDVVRLESQYDGTDPAYADNILSFEASVEIICMATAFVLNKIDATKRDVYPVRLGESDVSDQEWALGKIRAFAKAVSMSGGIAHKSGRARIDVRALLDKYRSTFPASGLLSFTYTPMPDDVPPRPIRSLAAFERIRHGKSLGFSASHKDLSFTISASAAAAFFSKRCTDGVPHDFVWDVCARCGLTPTEAQLPSKELVDAYTKLFGKSSENDDVLSLPKATVVIPPTPASLTIVDIVRKPADPLFTLSSSIVTHFPTEAIKALSTAKMQRTVGNQIEISKVIQRLGSLPRTKAKWAEPYQLKAHVYTVYTLWLMELAGKPTPFTMFKALCEIANVPPKLPTPARIPAVNWSALNYAVRDRLGLLEALIILLSAIAGEGSVQSVIFVVALIDRLVVVDYSFDITQKIFDQARIVIEKLREKKAQAFLSSDMFEKKRKGLFLLSPEEQEEAFEYVYDADDVQNYLKYFNQEFQSSEEHQLPIAMGTETQKNL